MDMTITTERLFIDGDGVAQVLAIEGTHIGDFMGMSPSGKPLRLAAVFLYELGNRQLIRERRLYDFTGPLVQIGVLKAKPAFA